MSQIIKQYMIAAQPEKVWAALTDPKVINEWSGEKAEMAEKKGAKFRLWGDYCFGKNTEVVRYRRLVQEWQEEDWTEPSIVTFDLSPVDGGTRLNFSQRNIPPDRLSDLEEGWDSAYIGPLKDFVGREA